MNVERKNGGKEVRHRTANDLAGREVGAIEDRRRKKKIIWAKRLERGGKAAESRSAPRRRIAEECEESRAMFQK